MKMRNKHDYYKTNATASIITTGWQHTRPWSKCPFGMVGIAMAVPCEVQYAACNTKSESLLFPSLALDEKVHVNQPVLSFTCSERSLQCYFSNIRHKVWQMLDPRSLLTSLLSTRHYSYFSLDNNDIHKYYTLSQNLRYITLWLRERERL
jgi:hypothetical protein